MKLQIIERNEEEKQWKGKGWLEFGYVSGKVKLSDEMMRC